MKKVTILRLSVCICFAAAACSSGTDDKDTAAQKEISEATDLAGEICTPDCEGKQCNDDNGCGETCGQCLDATGEPDTPAEITCDGKECGTDSTGASCGECEKGYLCNTDNMCEELPCDPPCDGELICSKGLCVDPPCEPVCEGFECGPDSCGGKCGSCPALNTCAMGHCECAFLSCGENCCGVADVCVEEGGETVCCTPACDNKTCGPDGCGGMCGDCPPNSECKMPEQKCDCFFDKCEGMCCQEDQFCADVDGVMYCCKPDCSNKECGDDYCAGSCGECPEGQTCNFDYQCEDGAPQ